MPRIAGALALVGGASWLGKVALIWSNGGTNTTDGLVGVLFAVGAGAILLAAVVRAWHLPGTARRGTRLLAMLVALVSFVALVDLPILVGWLVLGRTWVAEEIGVVLTALLALILGSRWLLRGFGTPRVSTLAK